MKKQILLLSFTLLMNNLFINAQEKNEKDTKAKVILDELSNKAKTYTTIKADFSYTIENKEEGINDTQKGSIWVKKEKYKLDIAGQVISCNGKTLWTYIKDVNEVQINNMSDMDDNEKSLINPMDIFTLYEKDFKYQFIEEKTIQSKTVQIIKLYPIKANDKAYHSIILTIDKNKKELVSFQMIEKDGNKFTYTINTFTPNLPMEDAFFNFDVSKADEVIDLR